MKKITRGMLAFVLAFILLLGSTLSYFTDREMSSATGTAGSVKIDLIPDVVLTDADGKDILNPGDGRKVNFTIQNVGNKSIDVQEFIKVTCTEPMTQTETQAEFELYKTTDVETLSNGSVVPKSGATPLAVRTVSDDKKTITYQVPDVVLDGNHATLLGRYEVEPEANGKDAEEEAYTLVFRRDSSNNYQDQTVTVEKLVNAKQHRNTGAGWELVAKETFTFHNGDEAALVPLNPGEVDPSTLRTKYNVSGNSGNFFADYDKKVLEDDPVTITLTADNGYHFNEGSVTTSDPTAVISFSNEGKTVTITVPSASQDIVFNANPTADVVPVTTYTVSGNEDEHMTANFAPSVEEGNPVNIQLSAGEGYVFEDGSVTCDDASAVIEISQDGKTATIAIASASQDVVFNAVPTEEVVPVTTYSVSGSTEHANASYNPTVEAGQEVQITLTADSGYKFADGSITCDDQSAVVSIGNRGTTATITIASASQDVVFSAAPIVDILQTSTAYAVYDSTSQTLYFIRSTDEVSNNTSGSITNIQGDTYTGTIYTGLESSNYSGSSSVPWYSNKSNITAVEFVDEISPTSTQNWFYGLNNCASIDFNNKLDTSATTNMVQMFRGCSSLTGLDLSDFDTSSVTSMSWIFTDCSSLTELNLSGWDTSSVRNMNNMFNSCTNLETIYASDSFVTTGINTATMFRNCSSLVGGNGTAYSSSHVDKTYACIDRPGTPGYFTADSSSDTGTVLYTVSGTLTNASASYPQSVEAGQEVQITLTADSGYKFAEGSVACNDTSAVIEISQDGKTATITIASASQDITFSATPIIDENQTLPRIRIEDGDDRIAEITSNVGTVTYNGDENVDIIASIPYKSSATITLTTEKGYAFQNNSDFYLYDDDSDMNTYDYISPTTSNYGTTATFTIASVEGNMTVQPFATEVRPYLRFFDDKYEVTSVTSGGETITPNRFDEYEIPYEDSATIVLTAKEGYVFDTNYINIHFNGEFSDDDPDGVTTTFSGRTWNSGSYAEILTIYIPSVKDRYSFNANTYKDENLDED